MPKSKPPQAGKYRDAKVGYFDRVTGKRVRRPMTLLADPRRAFVESYNAQNLTLIAKPID
jgi:hypothetical protein